MKLPEVRSSRPRAFAPVGSAFSKRFWQALEAGRFETTLCDGCGSVQYPPRPRCSECHGGKLQWIALSGRGRLYSKTRIESAGGSFAWMAPYSIGIVDLEEGVRVLTRLLHDASSLPLDSEVQLVVIHHTDGPLFAAMKAGDH